jgi:hypothetical protein
MNPSLIYNITRIITMFRHVLLLPKPFNMFCSENFQKHSWSKIRLEERLKLQSTDHFKADKKVIKLGEEGRNDEHLGKRWFKDGCNKYLQRCCKSAIISELTNQR